jgi:hypothetical protein
VHAAVGGNAADAVGHTPVGGQAGGDGLVPPHRALDHLVQAQAGGGRRARTAVFEHALHALGCGGCALAVAAFAPDHFVADAGEVGVPDHAHAVGGGQLQVGLVEQARRAGRDLDQFGSRARDQRGRCRKAQREAGHDERQPQPGAAGGMNKGRVTDEHGFLRCRVTIGAVVRVHDQ